MEEKREGGREGNRGGEEGGRGENEGILTLWSTREEGDVRDTPRPNVPKLDVQNRNNKHVGRFTTWSYCPWCGRWTCTDDPVTPGHSNGGTKSARLDLETNKGHHAEPPQDGGTVHHL